VISLFPAIRIIEGLDFALDFDFEFDPTGGVFSDSS